MSGRVELEWHVFSDRKGEGWGAVDINRPTGDLSITLDDGADQTVMTISTAEARGLAAQLVRLAALIEQPKPVKQEAFI